MQDSSFPFPCTYKYQISNIRIFLFKLKQSIYLSKKNFYFSRTLPSSGIYKTLPSEEEEGREMNLNMNSAESIVAQILALSTTPRDISQLHAFLKQSDDLIRSESTRLAPSLTQLDPSIHSLGFLYILYVLFFTFCSYFVNIF